MRISGRPVPPVKRWRLESDWAATRMRSPERISTPSNLVPPSFPITLRTLSLPVHDLIVEGNGAEEFRCPKPEVSAARITALLDGLAVQKVVRGSGPTATERKQWIDEVLDFELSPV